ncbi:MAG: alpha/beta fold hydrolase, partial [Bryobacteraceae bacterium]|nr:alpha/beta fold hydrolase [Bryobacteraceae bacterium]
MMLHRDVRGNGPPLILLHGLAGSNRWWRHNIEEFSRHFRVYALAFPEYGGMRRHGREIAVETAANWLLKAVDRLERGQRVSLIGHSTGGLICAMLAAMEPGRVHRMVLAASIAQIRPPVEWPMRETRWPRSRRS